MNTPTTISTAHIADDLTALRRYAEGGDPRAFEFLVHRYQSMVLATCLRATRSQTDAEDATQETFLKLAQGARRIRSNIAAWLHACAVRTSIDLIRRQVAQGRAERSASESDAPAVDEAERTWREIKPVLDAALADLDDADRELIVVRFFVGRSEAEMAREAGVNPGTMNRRIDKAVGRLRDRLAESGLAIGAAALLGGALGHGLAAPAHTGLTASIMEIGVAGVVEAAAPPAALASWVVVAASCTLGLAAIGGVAAFSGGPFTAAAPAVAMAEGQTNHERPAKAVSGLKATRMTVDGRPEAILVSDGRELTFTFEDRRSNPPKDFVIRIRITEVDRSKSPAAITATVVSASLPTDAPWGDLNGKTITGSAGVKGDQSEVSLLPPADPATGKPPPNSQLIGWQGFKNAAKQAAANAIMPELAGEWDNGPAFALGIDKENITITSGNWTALRFRIESWEAGPDYAKVQTLCTRNMDPSRIGERMKLLARRDANGWTLAMYDGPDRTKLNQWPASLVPKRGSHVRVVSFTEDR